MFGLVYVSSAVVPFSKAELLSLLTKSRENNSKVGLTGLLIYKDGSFMQVLEGEETAVLATHERIARSAPSWADFSPSRAGRPAQLSKLVDAPS